MTKFKNVFLLAAMAVSAVSVASCSDDDKPAAAAAFEIKAVVEGGDAFNDLIDEVRVTVGDETVTGKYVNGGFTIVLPASVPDKYLQAQGPGLYLLIGGRDFRPYNQDGLVAGVSFEYAAGFMYVNGDTTRPTGAPLSMKKGWNRVYSTDNGDITTTPPSGFTDKWSVYDYN